MFEAFLKRNDETIVVAGLFSLELELVLETSYLAKTILSLYHITLYCVGQLKLLRVVT